MTTEAITLILDGELTAESPIATCPPDATRRGKNDPQPLPKMLVRYGGAAVEVPYFPGSALRGTLRRRLFDCVRHASDGKWKPTLDDWYFNVLGGVKGADKEDKADIVGAAARRASNPINSLFGSGDPWMTGRSCVSHAIPSVPIDPISIRGARVDDFARDGSLLSFLDDEQQMRWKAIAEATTERSSTKREIEDLRRTISDKKASPDDKAFAGERLKTLEGGIAELAELGYSNAINRPLDGYEVIPVGTPMRQSVSIRFGSLLEVGALAAALRFWSMDPWIGAHKAHGSGVVSGRWAVKIRTGFAPSYSEAGEVSMTPFEGTEMPGLMASAEEEFMGALAAGKLDFRYPKAA